jgi:hypothetical protein
MRERESYWLRLERPALGTRAPALRFHRFKLLPRLLTIAQRIVCAEWDLLATGQEEFFAALHQVLLIERPGIHKVLQHDHDHVVGKRADG